jgi:hypothetical protein
MNGQGLVDEGPMRYLQDLLRLLRIIAGLRRLEKPVMMGMRGWPLAGTPEVPARFSARSSGGRADLLAFSYSGVVSAAAAALPAPPAGGTEVSAIITSADSTGRALCPA